MKKVIQNDKSEISNNKDKDIDKDNINQENDITQDKKEKKPKNKKLKKEDEQKISNEKKEQKKEDKKEETDQIDIIIESKYINFNIDFIFRREKYTLKNLYSNYLISKLKKLISKKLSIDIPLIHIYYLDKEITDDKLNVYDLIKDNKIKFFLVKKEQLTNENVISLNTEAHLIYQVRCYDIIDYKDFIDKIETFFSDRCIDKHYICEPFQEKGYDISFTCEDICFQFKRYFLDIKRTDKNYLKSKCELIPVDKSNIINSKYSNINNEYKIRESEFINKGPYMTYEEIQRKNEKEEKKKWLNKNGFKI